MIYAAKNYTTGLIKLGFSCIPEWRVRSLVGYWRQDIRLLANMRGSLREEHAIHDRFIHLLAPVRDRKGKLGREWYWEKPDIMEFIEREMYVPFLYVETPNGRPLMSFLIWSGFASEEDSPLHIAKRIGERRGYPMATDTARSNLERTKINLGTFDTWARQIGADADAFLRHVGYDPDKASCVYRRKPEARGCPV